jgi:hypothetical protein
MLTQFTREKSGLPGMPATKKDMMLWATLMMAALSAPKKEQKQGKQIFAAGPTTIPAKKKTRMKKSSLLESSDQYARQQNVPEWPVSPCPLCLCLCLRLPLLLLLLLLLLLRLLAPLLLLLDVHTASLAASIPCTTSDWIYETKYTRRNNPTRFATNLHPRHDAIHSNTKVSVDVLPISFPSATELVSALVLVNAGAGGGWLVGCSSGSNSGGHRYIVYAYATVQARNHE